MGDIMLIVNGKDQADVYTDVKHIEGHIHRQSRTYGKSADQSGTNWATEDRLTTFQAISGNGVYGADANDEAKIFGTTDTPVITGQVKFDLAEAMIVSVSESTTYILRFVWGTGTMAAAITAGQYSTVTVLFDSANPQLSAGIPIAIGVKDLDVGTKVWCQAKNATDNATIDFYITGVHGYDV